MGREGYFRRWRIKMKGYLGGSGSQPPSLCSNLASSSLACSGSFRRWGIALVGIVPDLVKAVDFCLLGL